VSKARVVALLVNPTSECGDRYKDAQAASAALGLDPARVKAASDSDLESAFETMVRLGVGALMVSIDPFLLAKPETLIVLAARYAIPSIYPRRGTAAGGLMSYEADASTRVARLAIISAAFSRAPSRSICLSAATKFNFVINLKTARVLGLEHPADSACPADEVIE